MNKKIEIKGNNDGLFVVINDDSLDFVEIMNLLKDKLDSAREFFSNTQQPLSITYIGKKDFSINESKILETFLKKYGLIYGGKYEPKKQAAINKDDRQANIPAGAKIGQVLCYPKTVRGGQEIRYNGTIIIMGDVNPAAKIYAEKDIFIAGNSRGMLHAGALGDRTATVVAGRFCGGQIRIADMIVSSPNDKIVDCNTEKALIKDDNIAIEPCSKNTKLF